MSGNFVKKLLAIFLIFLLVTPVVSMGCQEEAKSPAPASPGGLSSTLVPNLDLDIYVYIKQDSPTTLTADMTNVPFDIATVSLGIWGIATKDEIAFGGGLTLVSAGDAAKIHANIPPIENMWTSLSGDTIYFVQGSGALAQSLRTAISNNDFKYYDDQVALKAVSALPDGGTTKLAGVGIVKPSQELIGHLTKDADHETLQMIEMTLKLVRLDVVVAGLYSPRHIDGAEIIRAIGEDGKMWESDLGILGLVKSGVPGFVVEPIVKKFLTSADFVETTIGEVTLYRGIMGDEGSQSIPILVRVEGNRIFLAISGQESYAQTLITSVSK